MTENTETDETAADAPEAPRNCPDCGLETTQMEQGLSYCPDCEQDLPKSERRSTMTDKEQTEAFADDLDKLVERYRQEFEISYAQAVGSLQIKAWLLCSEANESTGETQQL
jgi:hypothetical protein